MKKRMMRHLGKMAVAGLAAFLLLAEPLTAIAYSGEPGAVTECTDENCSGHGEVILYDEQIVDMDGNIYPVNNPHARGGLCWLFGHEIIDGYLDTHLKNDSGGCTVKTYTCTACIYCDTIWVGDLIRTTRHVKCPH